MSALAAALAAFAARPSQDTHPLTVDQSQSPNLSKGSPSPSYTTLPSLTNSASASCSDISSLYSAEPAKFPHRPFSPSRVNEHLAVLLPKNLWKPDSLASLCDNFSCRMRFSIFERRHHCRKCGGVFCGSCTSRSTPLLDASNLAFLHPPRNVPLEFYESPKSPIIASRVCDDCWDQIHGHPSSPRIQQSTHASPISVFKTPSSPHSSSPTSSVLTPPNSLSPVTPHRALRKIPSVSSINSNARRLRVGHLVLPETLLEVRTIESEPSFGELDAYPLRRSSAICKATGGGRWEPKPDLPNPWYRIPGCKAPFELDMEREDAEERTRRSNPVVRDGEFQYRFLKAPEPMAMSRSPIRISTF